MAKFPEAVARLYHNVFICKRCKSKIRAQPQKVLQKKVKCRKCKSTALRPVKSKK